MQTPLQLDIWLQSYEGFDNAKNNVKQRNLNMFFADISKHPRHPTHSSWSCHIYANISPFAGKTKWLQALSTIHYLYSLTSRIGFQSRPEELMYTIPFLDTVAGEALSMLWGSKTTLQRGAIGMRSPLARVRVLLSSRTLLRFSIQMASTGPSSTIHTCSPVIVWNDSDCYQ